MNFLGEFSRLSLSLPSIYRCLSLFSLDVTPLLSRWLALFIEALDLSPNNEREGRQQLAILKGNIWYTYPDYSWSSPTKGSGGDAGWGSTMTSFLPLRRSWSCCTKMDAFA